MNTIGRLTSAIYRNMQISLANRLSDLHIKSGQYEFFYVISMEEGITQKQLSEHLRIGKSTTAKAVNALVRDGYVEKQKNGRDAREDHLYLTALGRSVAPAVAEIFQENLSVAARGLSPEEHEQLLRLMNQVLQNILLENARQTEA
ncbi:MAG: MarR family winged helix-turn-helix transcriptional regulator [Oscillospiraceae bacterium]|nr:MarR family winged helix-turn-helix transcriptional regulator [Oscillospiraceae bacterium]